MPFKCTDVAVTTTPAIPVVVLQVAMVGVVAAYGISLAHLRDRVARGEGGRQPAAKK